MNFNEMNFKFAFQFMGWDTNSWEYTSKDDPSFVKITVHLFGSDIGDVFIEKEVTYHTCTE